MAMEIVGKDMSVDEVMSEVLRDRPFYASSHGGVTLSGGEPLLQADFSFAVLRRCKEEGIHTAVETSANCRWDLLESLLPVTDLILMDIKHIDSHKHLQATGVPNKRILANARKLAQTPVHLSIHTPVVPTVNDTEEEIAAIALFVAELNRIRLGVDPAYPRITMTLLPFHRLAADKYKGLGLDYRASHLESPSKEKILELTEILQSYEVGAQ
jgi:pyruvate formate lyase activating enzyme